MRNIRMSTVSALIFSVIFLLTFPPQGESQPQPLYVTCPPPPESPWLTLQRAIEMAGSNTKINVTGTCNENIDFYSFKFFIILDGGGTAVINGNPGRPTVGVGGDNITIRGFTITGGQHGVFVYRNGYHNRRQHHRISGGYILIGNSLL
jgi:hypothetical protein